MTTGVVLVAYNAADIIVDCLESLMANTGVDLRIVVVDNASRDNTSDIVRDWAAGKVPLPDVAWPRPFTPVVHGPHDVVSHPEALKSLKNGQIGLIRSEENTGFAGGVNAGLEVLYANPDVDYFWVLNPDCMAEPTTAALLEARAAKAGRFGIIGGRIFYTRPANEIQSDGGRINLWTGICVPFGLGKTGRDTPPPVETDLGYIAGTHMFVSRDFMKTAGYMPEDYFLYYEEMDWCMRRGDLPLLFEAEAAVHHHGGHTIGSATTSSGPSPLSAYFMNRARIMFVRRYRVVALPLALAYSTARALRSILRGQKAAGLAALRGAWGFKPTAEMLAKINRQSLPKPQVRKV